MVLSVFWATISVGLKGGGFFFRKLTKIRDFGQPLHIELQSDDYLSPGNVRECAGKV